MNNHDFPKNVSTSPLARNPAGHDALLRLAEELGRLVGKFLADELAKQGLAPSAPSRNRKEPM